MKRLFWYWLLCPLSAMAQVSFDLQPRTIGINEMIQFSVVYQEEGPSEPEFEGGLELGDFQLASQVPRSERSISIVNGQTNSTFTFTYFLRPQKKGSLLFPSQTVVFKAKKFRSPPVTIDVGDEVRAVGSSRQRNPGNDPFSDLFGRRQRANTPAELFVEAQVSKGEVYLGEATEYDLKIYTTPGVQITNDGSSMDLPDFGDFWSEEMETSREYQRVNRNGKIYQVVNVDRRRLIPNKSGELEIGATRFSLRVAVGGGFFADWQTVQRETEPLKVKVKPLPKEGRPANFNGLVGRFTVNGSLDRDTIKVGESVSLKVDVSGEGNFTALNDIKLEGLDSSFELFEGGAPTTEKKLGRIVSKSWVFALVPKREGRFEVAVPRFSYFDLESQTYRQTGAQGFGLEVLPGKGLGPSLTTAGGEGRSLLSENNLSFIKLGELGRLDERQKLLPPIRLFQLAGLFLALNLVLFVGLWMWSQGRSRRSSLRPKYAYRNFQKTLRRLQNAKIDDEAFFAGVSGAILDYFGDKWERPGQGISLDLIEEKFAKRGFDNELVRRVAAANAACELARYLPSTEQSRQKLIDQASIAIGKVEEVYS